MPVYNEGLDVQQYGVLAGGTQVSSVEVVGTGGALAGATAPFSIGEVAEGGVVIAGTASVLGKEDKIGLGGSVVGGTAPVQYKAFVTASGGVEAAGKAYHYQSATYGGFFLYSSSINQDDLGPFIITLTGSGGVTAGGKAQFVYDITGLGGASLGGTATNSVGTVFQNETGSGGVTASGTGVVTNFVYNIGSGGSVVGGLGNVNVMQFFAYEGAGTAATSGDATETPNLQYVGDGQVTLDGTVDLDYWFIYGRHFPTGGPTLGGEAVCLPDRYAYTGIGTVIVGGAGSFDYLVNDSACVPPGFTCKILIPNLHKECFSSRYYRPAPNRLVPKTLRAKGAFLAASTQCRQYPYLPVPSRPILDEE